MQQRQSTIQLIRDVLKNDYIELTVQKYELEETVEESICRVDVTLQRGADGPVETISGSGVGFVDAIYHGLIEHYAREYPSLGTIRITGFEVTGNMNTTESLGADAECSVVLTILNTEDRVFHFEDRSRSLVAATTKVVIEAAEYFINSERAYITSFRALSDARSRNRPDLIESYTAQLAELVKTTSYSEVIERIKGESGI